MKTPIQTALLTLAFACGLAVPAQAKAYTEILHVDAALDRPVVPANQVEVSTKTS